MGELILLSERIADRSRPTRSAVPAFFFELGCPLSYLAAERVERALGDLEWIPTARLEPGRDRNPLAVKELLALAECQAESFRLPLIAPDSFPGEPLGAWRAAAFAIEQGAGAQFVLAASRMAFCGGYDLDDQDTIAEAAAAAGLAVDACVAAASDCQYDTQLFATARGLVARGIHTSPAIRIGSRWFEGIDTVAEASEFTLVRELYGAVGA